MLISKTNLQQSDYGNIPIIEVGSWKLTLIQVESLLLCYRSPLGLQSNA